MGSDNARYFEITTPKRKIVLPSGKMHIFYIGRPERNPITEERDIALLKIQADMFEVIAEKKGDKVVRWIRRPAEGIRSRRAVVTSKDLPSAKEGKPVPAKPVSKKDMSASEAGSSEKAAPPTPAGKTPSKDAKKGKSGSRKAGKKSK